MEPPTGSEVVADYQIVTGSDVKALAKAVRKAIEEGWQPHGPPSHNPETRWWQAMVRWGRVSSYETALRLSGAKDLEARLRELISPTDVTAMTQLTRAMLELEYGKDAE